MSEEEIIVEILNKGEFQLSDKERDTQLENLRLDIANIIVKMAINSNDGNQFPVSIITKAMNEVNCKINANKAAKPQAMAFINDLKKVLPIERAKMHLRLSFLTGEQAECLLKWLADNFANQYTIVSEKTLDQKVVVELQIDPALFREISNETKSKKDVYSGVTIEMI